MCKSYIKISDKKIFSEDWQIELTANKKIPDDLKFVGIHANFLKKVSEVGENIFLMKVEKIIEDEKFFIIELKNFETQSIFFEVEKNFWLANKTEEIFIKIPAEKIILLSE